MELKTSDFFYCYDKKLFIYLKENKNISYICTGLNQNNMKKFWQFHRTEYFNECLNEYIKQLNK